MQVYTSEGFQCQLAGPQAQLESLLDTLKAERELQSDESETALEDEGLIMELEDDPDEGPEGKAPRN